MNYIDQNSFLFTVRNLPLRAGFLRFKETIKPEFLIQKYYFKSEISNFIICRQTLAFRFLLDYNRLV